MRVLCTAVPGSGLFLPTVPLAWALRAAGHEVLLLNNGDGARAAAGAGLPVVDPLPERDLWAEFMAGGAATDTQFLMRYVPYNESRVVPGWVTLPPARRRVCVTLGSVLPALGGVGVLKGILAEMSTMDAEILLALGDIDISELEPLPT